MSRALWNAGVWKMWMGENASRTLDTSLLAEPYAASSRRMPTEIHHQLGLMELTGFLGESRFLVTGAISQFSSDLRGRREGGCRLQRETALSPSPRRKDVPSPWEEPVFSVVPRAVAVPLVP